MALTQHEQTCKNDCARCLGEAEPAPVTTDPLAGWRMALASGVCFLLPVALAATGAMWSGPTLAGEICGASAGLVTGVLVAVVAVRFVVPFKEKP